MPDESKGAREKVESAYSTYLEEHRSLVVAELDVSSRFDKSVLTLSGGALFFSMTFMKDIASKPHCTWALFLSWLILAMAVSAMLVSMLTSQSAFRRQRDVLDPDPAIEVAGPPRNPFARATHWLNVASIGAFLLAQLFMALFVWANMPGK